MKMKTGLLVCALMIAAFGGVSGQGKHPGGKPVYRVEHRGTMRDMFDKNDLNGHVGLQTLKNKPHLYALGPVEKLRGEILIWDSTPYISQVREDALFMETSWNHKAVFFVWTQVAAWETFPVPATVKTYDQLEKFIRATATKAKLDVTQPFPFLLKGKPEQILWHVVNVPPGETIHTREKHEQAKIPFRTEGEPVEMLGFYSEKHAGVFVHHTRRSHIHLRTVKGDEMGHVDEIALSGGMILSLPASQ